MTDKYDYLGRNLTLPFHRDGKGDFANASGVEAVNSALTIILGTLRAGPNNAGEVPWNQELGTLLPLLRHSNVNDPTTKEKGKFFVIDSIIAQEPRIKPKAVGFTPIPEENRISLKLIYDLAEDERATANVSPGESQEVEV